MTVALTGATGFLGGHVLRALQARGRRVRVLVRRWPAVLGPCEVEITAGALGDPGALRALVSGVTAVVHAAGAIKGPPERLARVNVDGTRALAEARRAVAPDARFVHVSTLAARAPELSAYARTKLEAETAVRAAGGELRILRPCAIYGPGDRETLKIFRLADGPVQPMLNHAEARVCLVHVADAAEAIAHAVDAAEGGPDPVEIADDRREGHAWREIAEAAALALGRRPRPVRIPAPALRMAGLLGDALDALGLAHDAPTSGKMREILQADW
ncbi:MAG: NAD-dependent epimerase/dehydratase family protein, partial [Pseudomonadota bacterium]